jgi:hypothetical protein
MRWLVKMRMVLSLSRHPNHPQALNLCRNNRLWNTKEKPRKPCGCGV